MKLKYMIVILFSTIVGADLQMLHGNIWWHGLLAVPCYFVACRFMSIGVQDPKEFNK